MAETSIEEQQKAIIETSQIKNKEGDDWYVIPIEWWITFCDYCGLNSSYPTQPLTSVRAKKPGVINYKNIVRKGDYLFKDELKEGIYSNQNFKEVHSKMFEYLKYWGYTDDNDSLRNGIRRKMITKGGKDNKACMVELYPHSVNVTVFKDGEMSKPIPQRIAGESTMKDLLRKVYEDHEEKKEEKKQKEEKEQKGEKDDLVLLNKVRAWYMSEIWTEVKDNELTMKASEIAQTIREKSNTNWITIMVEFKEDGKWPIDWTDFIYVGQVVDVQDHETNWYQAEVLVVEKHQIRVHFIGWTAKWDCWIPKRSTRLLKKQTRTSGPYNPNAQQTMSDDTDFSILSSESMSLRQTNIVGKPEVTGAVGLRNLGNTCFMNSTLQCLSNTPKLTQYFRNDNYQNDINKSNPLGFKGKLAISYADLIKEMWGSEFKTVAPMKFKEVISEVQPRFSGYQQHDSSELLQFLMDGLHEDLNRVIEKPYTASVESEGRPDSEVAKLAWDRHLKRNQSIIVDLCQGQLKSLVICPDCNRQSSTFDPYMFLSVPLPPNKREVSLDDCFGEFTKQEVLSEQEAWYCRECKKHQCASKKFDVYSLPDTLIIHLKRFKFDEHSRSKIETMVDFPIKNLNMKRWLSDKNVEERNCIFDLFAVSNHFGNLGGGHYTAYAKNLTDKKWYNLDDSNVRALQSASATRTANAYVLFYQRQSAAS